MCIGHRKEIRKLTFRALALRRSESRNCGCVWLIQKYGATLLVGAWQHEKQQNESVKSIILKNFKLLQNDPDTGRIFSQPPLMSFKRDKNIGNFLVSSAFQTSEQLGTFNCARAQCKRCPFIYNVEKLSGPKRSIKITDHFTVPQPMSSTV